MVTETIASLIDALETTQLGAAALALDADPVNRVTLEVDGKRYGGWQGIDIQRGIEAGASSFSFASAYRDPRTGTPYPLRPSQACKVLIGETPVITGWIDSVEKSIDADTRGVEVTGRSRTEDAVDCSAVHPTGHWTKRTIAQIGADLLAYYGLTLAVGPGLDDVERHFVLETGETPFEALERLARTRAAVIYDDAEGGLHVSRIGAARSTTPLVIPGNVLSARCKRDASGRSAEYQCKGQAVADDTGWADATCRNVGTVTDDVFGSRKRVMILRAEGPATRQECVDRALTEALVRAGKSVTGSVALRGWRQQSGALWTPNLLVPCDIPDVDLVGTYLATSCTFSLTDGGPRTALAVGMPGAYLKQRPKAKKAKAGKGAAWGELDFDLGDLD